MPPTVFAFALPLGYAFADVRAERHRAEIPDQYRSAVLRSDGNSFQIEQRPEIAQAANHVFGAAQLEHAPADLIRAVSTRSITVESGML